MYMYGKQDNVNLSRLYESGLNLYAMGDSQQRNPQNHLPTSDIKNSYGNASQTSQLPGNLSKGGINTPSENEESFLVKGFGKMTRTELYKLIDKTTNTLVDMSKTKRYAQMKSKTLLLQTLLKYTR